MTQGLSDLLPDRGYTAGSSPGPVTGLKSLEVTQHGEIVVQMVDFS